MTIVPMQANWRNNNNALIWAWLLLLLLSMLQTQNLEIVKLRPACDSFLSQSTFSCPLAGWRAERRDSAISSSWLKGKVNCAKDNICAKDRYVWRSGSYLRRDPPTGPNIPSTKFDLIWFIWYSFHLVWSSPIYLIFSFHLVWSNLIYLTPGWHKAWLAG